MPRRIDGEKNRWGGSNWGALSWGVPVGIAVAISSTVQKHGRSVRVLTSGIFLEKLLIMVVVFGLGGVLWGRALSKALGPIDKDQRD